MKKKLRFKFMNFTLLVTALPVIFVVSCGYTEKYDREELLNLYPETIITNRKTSVQKVKNQGSELSDNDKMDVGGWFLGIPKVPDKYNLKISFQIITGDHNNIVTGIIFKTDYKKLLTINGKGVSKLVKIIGYN